MRCSISQRARELENWPHIHTDRLDALTRKKGGWTNLINMGGGLPDINPPREVFDELTKCLDRKTFDGYAMPPSHGLLELREAIAEKLARENKVDIDVNSEITVTVGSSYGIFHILLATLNPNDEVIMMKPTWRHHHLIRFVDAVPVIVPLDEDRGWKPDPDKIKERITPRTKMLVIANPHNPTGYVFEREDLEAIADIVRSKDLLVLSDEAYEKFVYGGRTMISMASLPGMKERTLTTQSFSKSYCLTNQRVGFCFANKRFIDQIVKIMCMTVDRVSALDQKLAELALRADLELGWVKRNMIGPYEQRRDEVCRSLDRISRISYVRPWGAIFAFPNIRSFGMKSEDLAEFLLKEANVRFEPGTMRLAEGHFRWSWTPSRYKEGLRRVEEVLSKF